MPIIPRPNRDALSRGIDIYRDTMRPFILTRLGELPGPLEDTVRNGLPLRQVEEFDRDLQRTQDLASALDVNLFPRLVEAYWLVVFSNVFTGDSQVQEHMRKIKHARNEVAHPPTGDLARGSVRHHLELVAGILGRIGATQEQQDCEQPLPPSPADYTSRRDGPGSERRLTPTGPRAYVGLFRFPTPPPTPSLEYHVYTDIPTRRTRVHSESCQYYRNRKDQTLDDNYWHGPYATVDEAISASRSDPDTRWDPLSCRHCLRSP